MALLIWFSNFENVSSQFENQINKAITSCFYAVKLRAVYNTRVMLPSAKKCWINFKERYSRLSYLMSRSSFTAIKANA